MRLAVALAAAFAAGLTLALAPLLFAPAHDAAGVRVEIAAAGAAATLRAGLAQRRREIEFLASIFPAGALQPFDRDALRLFLRRAQELSPYYALIGFVDANGRLLVSSNGLAEGDDVAGRDYFTHGRTATYVSDGHRAIVLAKALGGADAAPRLIDVATPVSEGGRPLGVLIAHVSAEWAQVIATTTARQAGLDGVRLVIRSAAGEEIAAVGADEKAALSSAEAVSGLGDGGSARWTVIAKLPRSPGPSLARYWPWALAGLAGIALSAGLGRAAGRRMTRSLENHTLSAPRLAGGGAPELGEETTPELSDLGAAIRMAAEELACFGGEKVQDASPSRFSKNISA
jgi:hypothetical protein